MRIYISELKNGKLMTTEPQAERIEEVLIEILNSLREIEVDIRDISNDVRVIAKKK